jgi:phage tail-like protein
VTVAPTGRIAFTTANGFGWTSGSAARYATEGTITTYRLDSGGYRTRWGRVFLDACRPPGTAIGLRFVTTDDDTVTDPMPPAPPDRGGRVVVDPESTPPLVPLHLLDAAAEVATVYRRPNGNERAWLPADGAGQTYETPVHAPPGRYLWVQIRLSGTARTSPTVRALRVERPGHPLLGALPRAWSRDEADADFLQRMLAPAEGLLQELDERAAHRASLVNPGSVPSASLAWLASLTGTVLDHRWPEPAQRTLIAEAYQLYSRRGTVAALVRWLAIYLGRAPTLIENWQLRGLAGSVLGTQPGPNTAPRIGGAASAAGSLGRILLGGSAPGTTSYQPTAHRFTVLIHGTLGAEQRTAVQDILDRHRPAHTLAEVCELGAGMRVGSQLRVRLTSYVGPSTRFDPAVTGQVRIGANGVIGLPAAGSRVAGSSVVGKVRVG